MENPIDQRYRLDLIAYQLEGVESKDGGNKFTYYCPFCQVNRNPAKYANKKAAMIFYNKWNAWRFNCMGKGCLHSTTFYRFLSKLSPKQAENYQREREDYGLTGKGTDTPKIRRNKKRDETL